MHHLIWSLAETAPTVASAPDGETEAAPTQRLTDLSRQIIEHVTSIDTWIWLGEFALGCLLAILSAIILVRIMRRIMARMFKQHPEREAMVTQIIGPVRWLAVLLVLLVCAEIGGVNLAPLWSALLTILGLVAIGFFAVWSLLSNLLGGFLLLGLRTVQIGGEVEILQGTGEPSIRGRVHYIGFFHTVLVAADQSVLRVPNNMLFQVMLRTPPGSAPPAAAGTQGAKTDVPGEKPMPERPVTFASSADKVELEPVASAEDEPLRPEDDPTPERRND